jgi:hypothetical protein
LSNFKTNFEKKKLETVSALSRVLACFYYAWNEGAFIRLSPNVSKSFYISEAKKMLYMFQKVFYMFEEKKKRCTCFKTFSTCFDFRATKKRCTCFKKFSTCSKKKKRSTCFKMFSTRLKQKKKNGCKINCVNKTLKFTLWRIVHSNLSLSTSKPPKMRIQRKVLFFLL